MPLENKSRMSFQSFRAHTTDNFFFIFFFNLQNLNGWNLYEAYKVQLPSQIHPIYGDCYNIPLAQEKNTAKDF